MNAVDEIVVHGRGKVQQLLLAAGVFGPLDVRIPQGIGFLRAEAALDGGAADKTGEHRDAGFRLAQRVGAGYRHPAAKQAGTAVCLHVVEVPVAHHVQQRPLGRIDLVPVPLRRLGRFGGMQQLGGHDDVAVMQRLPGQAVVQHQQVAAQQHVGHDRQAGGGLHELLLPGDAQLQPAVEIVPQLDLPFAGGGVEHRPQQPESPQYTVLPLKCCAPDKPQRGSQKERITPNVCVLHQNTAAAESRKGCVQHRLVGTVGKQQFPLGVIAPGGNGVTAGHKFLQKRYFFMNIHGVVSFPAVAPIIPQKDGCGQERILALPIFFADSYLPRKESIYAYHSFSESGLDLHQGRTPCRCSGRPCDAAPYLERRGRPGRR